VVLGECCPVGRDSSLNLVLVFVSDVVPGRHSFQYSLDLRGFNIYHQVTFQHHLIFSLFIFTSQLSLSSFSSCNLCHSSCGDAHIMGNISYNSVSPCATIPSERTLSLTVRSHLAGYIKLR